MDTLKRKYEAACHLLSKGRAEASLFSAQETHLTYGPSRPRRWGRILTHGADPLSFNSGLTGSG
jgi:hypothetical protein